MLVFNNSIVYYRCGIVCQNGIYPNGFSNRKLLVKTLPKQYKDIVHGMMIKDFIHYDFLPLLSFFLQQLFLLLLN